MTYVSDLRDLYRKTQLTIRQFGSCTFASSEHLHVEFVCYGALVFYVAMPREPYSSLSVSHIYGPDGNSSHVLLGHDLTFVENTEEAFSAAFEAVREFSRLRLPDKYLEAWEAAEQRKRS